LEEVNPMQEKTRELIQKFEQDHEINVGITETLTDWEIFAQIPKKQETGFHTLHIGRKYITGPNENGNVRIIPDPRNSDEYQVESWGKMELYDDFVEKALAHILADRDAAEKE
jgi:hypothetical protein